MIPKTDDGRVLFAIPWRGRVLLGTTDTPVEPGDPRAPPLGRRGRLPARPRGPLFRRASPRSRTSGAPSPGLRPLLGKGGSGRTASLSREHAVFVSDSGLVTITGGKWTTYRRMGLDAVDRAAEVAGLSPTAARGPRISGSTAGSAEARRGAVRRRYGSDAPELARLVADQPGLGRADPPEAARAKVEVIWAARHELARSVEDVLARRTRGLFLDARASIEAAPLVARCWRPSWAETRMGSGRGRSVSKLAEAMSHPRRVASSGASPTIRPELGKWNRQDAKGGQGRGSNDADEPRMEHGSDTDSIG